MHRQKMEPQITQEEGIQDLPPGFRFHPTDDELVSYYLIRKVGNGNIRFHAIGEVDFNKCEPWDLPAKAKIGENMFYFFSLRDRKYPTGMRTNRATEAGYWKATGKDRDVHHSPTGRLVGMKKTLVFYTGRAPKGEKTNWIMHEYRLEDESTPHQQEWVVCRVFEKSAPSKKMMPADSNDNPNFMYNTNLQPCSSLPPLQNLEPPSPPSVRPNYAMYPTGIAQLAEQQSYYGASIPGHESILRRAPSIARRDSLSFGDSLEHILSGFDYNQDNWPGDFTGSH